MLYRYFIGSNNITKQLEKEKALDVVNRYFEGFTVLEGQGFWKGSKEDTLIIEINTDEPREKMDNLAHDLAVTLQQEAIGLEVLNTSIEFIA